MKRLLIFLASMQLASATVIDVVTVYQALSLHGSDVDDEVDADSGESLQAAVMPIPMALSGEFPEAIVRAVTLPLRLTSNNTNYKIPEVNLCQLCGIKIETDSDAQNEVKIQIDISALAIPEEVDLTARQVIKLISSAIRRSVTEYNKSQKNPLSVNITITGTVASNATLRDLSCDYIVPGAAE